MNRFTMNPYLRYPQPARNVLKPAYKPVPTQDMRNDDNISIASESTYYAQHISDDFKADVSEVFKSLIESTQRNFAELIESVKYVNHNEINAIKEQTKAEIPVVDVEDSELDLVKEQILKLKDNHLRSNTELQEQLAKVIEVVKFMKKKKTHRRPPIKRMPEMPIGTRDFNKVEKVPCRCFMLRKGVFARSSILKKISSGDWKCECC